MVLELQKLKDCPKKKGFAGDISTVGHVQIPAAPFKVPSRDLTYFRAVALGLAV